MVHRYAFAENDRWFILAERTNSIPMILADGWNLPRLLSHLSLSRGLGYSLHKRGRSGLWPRFFFSLHRTPVYEIYLHARTFTRTRSPVHLTEKTFWNYLFTSLYQGSCNICSAPDGKPGALSKPVLPEPLAPEPVSSQGERFFTPLTLILERRLW